MQRLENLLNDFVAAVIDLAERHRLWAALRAREKREREEAERRAELESARREIERLKARDLRRRVTSWMRARHIDELLEAFAGVHGEKHAQWTRWAFAEAERLRGACCIAARGRSGGES
jgi:hypothetical protein